MTTQQDEVRERVRAYVQHNAVKSPEALKEVSQKGQDQLLELIHGLSDEQASFKANPDDWSVLEVLQHLIESKRGIARICAALARGELPASSARVGVIEREPFSSLAQARSALDEAQRELLAFVDTLSPETNLEATYDHPWFGPHNCKEWVIFQRLHDGDHIGQIERIKSAAAGAA